MNQPTFSAKIFLKRIMTGIGQDHIKNDNNVPVAHLAECLSIERPKLPSPHLVAAV
jgi:hypothetical protein